MGTLLPAVLGKDKSWKKTTFSKQAFVFSKPVLRSERHQRSHIFLCFPQTLTFQTLSLDFGDFVGNPNNQSNLKGNAFCQFQIELYPALIQSCQGAEDKQKTAPSLGSAHGEGLRAAGVPQS